MEDGTSETLLPMDADPNWDDPVLAMRRVRAVATRIVRGEVSPEQGAWEIASDSMLVGDPVYPCWPDLSDELTHTEGSRTEVEAKIRSAAQELLDLPPPDTA